MKIADFDKLKEYEVWAGENILDIFKKVKSEGGGWFIFNGVYCPVFEDTDWEFFQEMYHYLLCMNKDTTKLDYIRYVRMKKLEKIEER